MRPARPVWAAPRPVRPERQAGAAAADRGWPARVAAGAVRWPAPAGRRRASGGWLAPLVRLLAPAGVGAPAAQPARAARRSSTPTSRWRASTPTERPTRRSGLWGRASSRSTSVPARRSAARDAPWGIAKDGQDRLHIFAARKNVDGRTDADRVVVRLSASGAVDTTFGTAGFHTLNIGNVSDSVRNGFVQPDGKIVTSGYYSQPTGVGTQTANRIVLARLHGGDATGAGGAAEPVEPAELPARRTPRQGRWTTPSA